MVRKWWGNDCFFVGAPPPLKISVLYTAKATSLWFHPLCLFKCVGGKVWCSLNTTMSSTSLSAQYCTLQCVFFHIEYCDTILKMLVTIHVRLTGEIKCFSWAFLWSGAQDQCPCLGLTVFHNIGMHRGEWVPPFAFSVLSNKGVCPSVDQTDQCPLPFRSVHRCGNSRAEALQPHRKTNMFQSEDHGPQALLRATKQRSPGTRRIHHSRRYVHEVL